MAYDDTQASGTVIDFTEWNNMITAMKAHSNTWHSENYLTTLSGANISGGVIQSHDITSINISAQTFSGGNIKTNDITSTTNLDINLTGKNEFRLYSGSSKLFGIYGDSAITKIHGGVGYQNLNIYANNGTYDPAIFMNANADESISELILRSPGLTTIKSGNTTLLKITTNYVSSNTGLYANFISANNSNLSTGGGGSGQNYAYTYIIYSSASNYYARNGYDGHISFTDTSANPVIAQALNACKNSGGGDVVLTGMFEISGLVFNNHDNVTLRGLGWNTGLQFPTAGTVHHMIWFSGSMNNRTNIQNMKLLGYGRSKSFIYSYGDLQYSDISNLYMEGQGANIGVAIGRSSYINFHDNIINCNNASKANDAVAFYPDYGNCYNNIIFQSAGTGDLLTAAQCKHTKFVGNTLRNLTGTTNNGIFLESNLGNIREIIIANNTLDACNLVVRGKSGATYPYSAQRISIVNNIIHSGGNLDLRILKSDDTDVGKIQDIICQSNFISGNVLIQGMKDIKIYDNFIYGDVTEVSSNTDIQYRGNEGYPDSTWDFISSQAISSGRLQTGYTPIVDNDVLNKKWWDDEYVGGGGGSEFSSGWAEVSSTSIIAHGYATTPTVFGITPSGDATFACSITEVDTTNMTVHLSVANKHTVRWWAGGSEAVINHMTYPQNLEVSRDSNNNIYYSGQGTTYVYSGANSIIISSQAGSAGGSGANYGYDYLIYKDGANYKAQSGVDGTIISTKSYADGPIIDALNALHPTGGKIFISKGTHLISSQIIMKPNITMEFAGKLKLQDNGTQQTSMIAINTENVTLINPMLDQDWTNNVQDPGNGTQFVLRWTNAGKNCSIIGGYLWSGSHCGIGGAGHNIHIQDLTIKNPYEHGVYFSTHSSGLSIDNVRVFYPGSGTSRGYGYKIDNCSHSNISNSYVEYHGTEQFSGDSSIGVVCGKGSRRCDIQLTVKNADYGFCVVNSGNNLEKNSDISISLNMLGSGGAGTSNLNCAGKKSHTSNLRVYNTYMERGSVNPRGLGENALIENVYCPSGYVYAGDTSYHDYNSSYTLRNCNFKSYNTNYTCDLRCGENVLIDNCLFENGRSNYGPLAVQKISGTLIIKNSTFKGGDTYGMYLNSNSKLLIIENNNIGLSGTARYYGDDWSGPPSYVIRSGSNIPDRKIIRDNYGYRTEYDYISSSTISSGHITTGFEAASNNDVVNKLYFDANNTSGSGQNYGYDFYIYKDGSNYCVQKGTDGSVSSNTGGDASKTFQYAIDNCGNGGLILVGSGQFLMKDNITISNKPLTLEGTGAGGKSGNAAWGGQTVLQVPFDTSGDPINSQHKYMISATSSGPNSTISYINIKNLTIDGRDQYEPRGALNIFNVTHGIFENLYIDDFYGRTAVTDYYSKSGIAIMIKGTPGSQGGGCYYNQIRNCKTRRCTVGCFVSGNSNAHIFFGNQFSGRNEQDRQQYGFFIDSAETCTVYGGDIEGMLSGNAKTSTGVYFTSSAGAIGWNFFGQRFEGNARDIFVSYTTYGGNHNFWGGSVAVTKGVSYTDNQAGTDKNHYRSLTRGMLGLGDQGEYDCISSQAISGGSISGGNIGVISGGSLNFVHGKIESGKNIDDEFNVSLTSDRSVDMTGADNGYVNFYGAGAWEAYIRLSDGRINTKGDLIFNTGGDIGVASDTDLMQIASSQLTINGDVDNSGYSISTSTISGGGIICDWISGNNTNLAGTGYWSKTGDNIYYDDGEVHVGHSGFDCGTYNFQVSGDSYFSGNVSFIGELSGLADPTYASGASNKHYIDTISSNIVSQISNPAYISAATISGGIYTGGLHYPYNYVFYKVGSTYYAKKCDDGSTTSSADFDTLFNGISNSLSDGGHLHINAGTYTINNPLVINNHYTTLTGEGDSTRISGYDTANSDAWANTDAGIKIDGEGNTIWGITIRNIRTQYVDKGVWFYSGSTGAGSNVATIEHVTSIYTNTGFLIDRLYVANFRDCRSWLSSGNGFLYTARGAAGGSVNFIGCATKYYDDYAQSPKGKAAGFYIEDLNGSCFVGCVPENGRAGSAFYISGGYSLSFDGCYGEGNTDYFFNIQHKTYNIAAHTIKNCYGEGKRSLIDAAYVTIEGCVFTANDDTKSLELTSKADYCSIRNSYMQDGITYSGNPEGVIMYNTYPYTSYGFSSNLITCSTINSTNLSSQTISGSWTTPIYRGAGKPVAAVGYEGQIIRTSGSAGDKTWVWMCLKNDADGYEWIQLGVSS